MKKEEITLKDYILTNIDLKTLNFTIRLKDNKEYIIYHKKENGKNIIFIKKDNKEIPLSNEIEKKCIYEIKIYNKDDI